jgi:hypothetical protein
MKMIKPEIPLAGETFTPSAAIEAHLRGFAKRMLGREKGHEVTQETRDKISATLKAKNAAERARNGVTDLFPARAASRKIRGRHTHENRAKIAAATRLAMADPDVRDKVIAANSRRGIHFRNRRRDKVRCVQCAFLAEPRYMELERMTDGSKQWQCISVKACEKRLSAMMKVAA